MGPFYSFFKKYWGLKFFFFFGFWPPPPPPQTASISKKLEIFVDKIGFRSIKSCSNVHQIMLTSSDRPKPEFKPKPKYRNFGLVWTDTETEAERRSIPKPKPKFLFSKTSYLKNKKIFAVVKTEYTQKKTFQLKPTSLLIRKCLIKKNFICSKLKKFICFSSQLGIIACKQISVFGSILNRNFGRNRKIEWYRSRNRNAYRNLNFGRNRKFPITINFSFSLEWKWVT